ncbi:hypothetical protein EMCRGX_G024160 [Ephydatia muelleri]
MKRSRTSSSTSASKPSSGASEEPPKKAKKVEKVAPVPEKPKPHELPGSATLGSLPLYGEKLPEQGYAEVPIIAKQTCDELKEIFAKVREIKQGTGPKADLDGHRQKGTVLFTVLKKMNRLSHLYCKDTRDQTYAQKLEVDDLHLQLQNLMYEVTHLQKEITNCLEFKSQHEDIDLVSEEEFYKTAPESISKPDVTRSDEHQRMLCRLQWELEQRKQLASQQATLEEQIKRQEGSIGVLQEHLNGLQPSLENLRKTSLPLQELLNTPLDKQREDYEVALLLPMPLYILYSQVSAYAQVEDHCISVTISGDKDEAKACHNIVQLSKADADSDSDGETAMEEHGKKHHRHHDKEDKGTTAAENKDVIKAHPLVVILTLQVKGLGSLQVTFSYLPSFNAICASVTSVHLAHLSDAQHASFLDNSSILHCLFEGDTGRTSPKLCCLLPHPQAWGRALLLGCASVWVPDGGRVLPQIEVAASYVGVAVATLKQRFSAQGSLTRQLIALEEHKLLSHPADSDLFHRDPGSEWVRWKQVSPQDAQGMQFGSLSMFNFQEKTNRFYIATFQQEQTRLHSLLSVGVDYPATPPRFAIMMESSAGHRDPFDIQIKNLEAEVNIHFPQSLIGDDDGQYLLCRQIKKLRECFDIYLKYKKAPGDPSTKILYPVRGKARLLSYSDAV